MANIKSLLKLSGDHTIDADLLPDKPIVLDVGCRGFDFARDILALRPEALVVCMDPDPAIVDPNIPGIHYIQKALVHEERNLQRYASYSSGEANFITELPSYYDARMLWVSCVTLPALMLGLGIKHWDLVKLDCEGSEFGILREWPDRCATQISVEFHDWEHREKYDDAYYGDLFRGRLRDYEVVQHGLTGVGPGNAMGHWDSLLVLRGGS